MRTSKQPVPPNADLLNNNQTRETLVQARIASSRKVCTENILCDSSEKSASRISRDVGVLGRLDHAHHEWGGASECGTYDHSMWSNHNDFSSRDERGCWFGNIQRRTYVCIRRRRLDIGSADWIRKSRAKFPGLSGSNQLPCGFGRRQ